MLSQAQSRFAIHDGVKQHGVAPGARQMIDWEDEAAELALQTGMYGVYRSSNGQDCTRIGSSSKCFCGHLYSNHTFLSKKAPYPRCTDCACSAFRFIPTRPEEVGDWWLVRRKGFNVHTWRAKCRCGHSHEEHDPKHMRCRCGCSHFQSNFACVACDKLWEDHETVFETIQERLAQGKAVGDAYRPLADDAQLRGMVFSDEARKASATANRLRPKQVSADRAEKSVQIMHETSGGVIKGQDVANRYGKVVNPPKEWLYMGGGWPGDASNSLEAGPGPSGGGWPGEAGGSLQRGPAAASITARAPSAAGVQRPGSRVGTAGPSVSPRPAGAISTQRAGVGASRQVVGSTAGTTAQPKAMSSGFRPVYD